MKLLIPTHSTIKSYYRLTKPGIVYGNLITAAAGFLFASYSEIDIGLMAATLAGIGLLIATACVLNNYIDRGIDSKMTRTKNRALAAGTISTKNAFWFAAILAVASFCLLAVFTNFLTVMLGFIALVNYVVFYGLTKRKSQHGTLVGSISGALPITAGYTAVAGQFDMIALLLFLILVFWQMPHFYAIAIYRKSEYKAAGLPVLPLKTSIRHTKFQILIYIVLFVAAVTMLATLGYTGKTYLVVMTIAGGWWLVLTARGFYVQNHTAWARKMFFISLNVLLIFSIMISVDNLLP